LLALPAGVGFATARSILKLWIGFSPERSGVFSAGNGAAMRAPIIGAAVDDLDAVRELVRASTRITHTDKKAAYGALTVAIAAHMACRQELVVAEDFLARIEEVLGADGTEMHVLTSDAVDAVRKNQDTQAFAASIGLETGVSGYVYHTVPIAIHAWLTNQRDFRAAIVSVIQCGGDTDSTAAIVGGIVGAAVGEESIPDDWRNGLFEWPRSVSWMKQLGAALASGSPIGSKRATVSIQFFAGLIRNMFFLPVVLFFGFRRLFPPY
jgi:ADP-ribosylglycohydrolase